MILEEQTKNPEKEEVKEEVKPEIVKEVEFNENMIIK
jgi:hypothetical protein